LASSQIAVVARSPANVLYPLAGQRRLLAHLGPPTMSAAPPLPGRVGMWRGGGRLNISVSASFVWPCLSGSAVTPFPHPAHRTGRADFPHPALGQDITPSPTARRAQAQSGGRARSARTDARVDRSRPGVA